MPIGAVLLQPQKVRRANTTLNDYDLLGEVAMLIARVIEEEASAGRVQTFVAQAFEAMALRFVAQAGAGLASLEQKVAAWIQPLGQQAQTLAVDLGSGDAAKAAALVEKGVSFFAHWLENLTPAQLRDLLAQGMDLIRKDLGVTEAFIEGQIGALIDDIARRFQQAPSQPSPALQENRLEIIAILGRLKHRLFRLFTMPTLDTDRFASEITLALARTGFLDRVRQVAKVTAGLTDLVAAGMSLNEAVSLRLSVHVGGPVPPPPVPQEEGRKKRRGRKAAIESSQALAPGGNLPAGAPPTGSPPPASKERYLWYATSLLEHEDSYLIGTSDFNDKSPLAKVIKSGMSMPSQHLKRRFSDEFTRMLDDYNGTDPPSEELQKRLAYELNVVIQGELLTGELDIAVGLDPHTSDLLKEIHESKKEDQGDKMRFNRMVLEDAYPNEIDSKARNGVWRFLIKTWRFVLFTLLKYPGDKYWIDKGGRMLLQADRPFMLAPPGEVVDWTKSRFFARDSKDETHYTFGHIPEEVVETIFWVTAWVRDAGLMIVYIVKTVLEEGKRIAHTGDALYYATRTGFKLIARKPISGYDFCGSKFLDWDLVVPLLGAFPGSLLACHTKSWFWRMLGFWFTVLGDDAGGLTIDWPGLVLDGGQSFITLFNFVGPKDTPEEENRAKNREELGGIVAPIELAFAYWLATLVEWKKGDPRIGYTSVTSLPGSMKAQWLGGGIGMGVLAGFVGCVTGEIIAWAEDFALLGKTIGITVVKMIFLDFSKMYSALRDGDTDFGKYNPNGKAHSGYPSRDTSPYFLPYEADLSVPCLEGNQGSGSHNFVAAWKDLGFFEEPEEPHTFIGPTLVYAYDFGLDEETEILASRPGTVVDYKDDVDNHETDSFTFNYIRIRHDVDNDGNPIEPLTGHDLDGNDTVLTFAEYRHGMQGSVVASFAAHSPSVPITEIIGKKVKRGQAIMQAGGSGIGAFSSTQVHMHIVPEKLPRPGPAVTDAVPSDQYTIPFVFNDVEDSPFQKDRDKGVCKTMTWYTSKNKKVT